jgi:hypothetical protein
LHCQIGAFRSKRRGEAKARKDKNGRVTRKDEVKSTFLEGRQAGGTSSERVPLEEERRVPLEEERRGRRSTSKKREGAGGIDTHTTTARERDK